MAIGFINNGILNYYIMLHIYICQQKIEKVNRKKEDA